MLFRSVPAVPFIISSPENGIFNTAVELEEKITAGQTHLSKPIVIDEVIKTILRYVYN